MERSPLYLAIHFHNSSNDRISNGPQPIQGLPLDFSLERQSPKCLEHHLLPSQVR